ncbi:MAG: polysaccharide deacetylase family protein [Dehalococcoidia bacterium]
MTKWQRLTVLSADFDGQPTYLDCAGYTAISVADMFEAIAGRRALPPHPVILTFDDGYTNHYTQVFPMLHGYVGSFAIVTGFVEGGGPYVTWAQVREMSDAGMEMLAHTVSHADLGASNDVTVVDQLTRSRQPLAEATGRDIDFLVDPSGEPFRSGSVERQQQVVEDAFHGVRVCPEAAKSSSCRRRA